MSKIPCKKCEKCNLYHDLSVMKCNECDTDLTNIPALLMEIDDIPTENYGEISENVPIFVQKCSACGVDNFTAYKELRVMVCHGCNKQRVAAVDPVEYEELIETRVIFDDKDITSSRMKQDEVNNEGTEAYLNDNDEDEDEADFSPWSGILCNIRADVGSVVPNPVQEVDEKVSGSHPVAQNDDDDDDDADVTDWSEIVGQTATQKKESAVQSKTNLTLTAIRYGRLSFTIKDKDGEYKLGRSANQKDFLDNDLRVGNEHCTLYFKAGAWYVRDEHARNGTKVNSRILDSGAECVLNDGDELILGHNPDSMAFKITIR